MKRETIFLAMLACGVAGCAPTASDDALVERVEPGRLLLQVRGGGFLRAPVTTQVFVPGSTQWSQARLDWLAPDGATVAKGDVVARFAADKGRQELTEAELQIDRSTLEQRTATTGSALKAAKTTRDLAKVRSELDVARIYARAGNGALSRNKLLDAIQDERYLNRSQQILRERAAQAPVFADAEREVADARREAFETVAQDRRKDLGALEIRAPHGGLFMVERNWAGDKVHAGTTLPAGNVFGNLPDTSSMEIEVSIEQIDGEYLRPGMALAFAPVGAPAQLGTSRISWVSTGAHIQNNDSPVKYFTLRAPVPAEVIQRYRWAPGQAFTVTVTLFDVPRAVSVPNLALGVRDGHSVVTVRQGHDDELRYVVPGHRGIDRTEIVEGLRQGDQIVVDPTQPGRSGTARR